MLGWLSVVLVTWRVGGGGGDCERVDVRDVSDEYLVIYCGCVNS